MPTSSRKKFFLLFFSFLFSKFLRSLTSSLPACNLKEIRLKLRWGLGMRNTDPFFFFLRPSRSR